MDNNTTTTEVESDNIFESAWNNYVKPTVSAIGDIASNAYDATKDVVNDIASGDFNIFENDAVNDAKKIQKTSIVSDEDRNLAKELNQYSWWEMAKDLWSGLMSLGKNKLFGSSLSSKLKIWEEEFNKWLEWFTTQRENIQKELDQISAQYQTVSKVNADAEAKYKAERWVSSITNYEDFNAYRMQYIKTLDPITLKKVQYEITDMQQKAWAKMQELDNIDASMKDYLSTNVEWWVEAYDKINQEQADMVKGNKYFEMIQKISTSESMKLDDELNKRWASMSKLWNKFTELRDSVLEDRTADQQYYLSLLGMDIPDNEKIAEQFKRSSDVSKKFNIDLITNIANNRDLPEYKWLSDVDYRYKMMEITWKSLTNEEKDLFRKKETIVTWVQQLQEIQSMKDRSIFNPLLVLDAVNYVGATMQGIIDQVYDYEWGVPNYVKSESRNILYSGEGLLKKATSSILYNTDALASFAAMGWALKLAKITKLDSIAANATDKILKIPTKIWFGEWTVNIIGSWVKWVTKSLISNAATDPIFDSVMQEAPTDAIQEFNTLTGPLFDAWFWALMQWGSRVIKKTWNELLYEFMTKGEDKAIIDDLVSFYKANGSDVSRDDAKTLLSEWSKQILSITNPDRIKEIFTKPGELYNFVSSNVKNMENNGMKSMITETGLWINIEKLLWVPEGTYSDIKSLATYLNTAKEIPENTRRVVQASLEKHFDNIQSFIDGKMLWGVRVMNSSFTNPEYRSLRDSVDTGVRNIKNILTWSKWTTYLDDIVEQIDSIQDSIGEIHKKFTNQKTIRKVNIHPIDDPKRVVSIAIDDLDEMQWMSWNDVIRTWRVTIPAWKNLPAWEYAMAWIKSANVKSTFSQFMNWKRQAVQEFIAERWYGHIDIWKTVENVLSWWDRKKAVQIGYLNDIAKKEWMEKALKESEAFADFMVQTFKDIYWAENVWSAYNISAIDKIKKDSKWFIANPKEYVDFANSQEWGYNIMHGYFEGKNWITFSMHYTFGKKFNDEPFAHKLTWAYKVESGNVSFDNFLQSTWSINDTIMTHAMRWNNFDFETGLARARSIESVWSGYDMFEKWKISKSAIGDLLKKVWIDDEVARDFVYNVIKDVDERYVDYVRPIIYNLAHTYHTNKWVVDLLVSRLKASDKYIDAFASIILSPSIIKWVSDKIAKKDWDEVLSLIRANLERETAVLNTNNLEKIDTLEKKISVLKEIKSWVTSKARKEELESDIQKTIKQINQIKKWSNEDISIVNKLTEKRLKDMAKSFALSVISWKEARYADEAKYMESLSLARQLPNDQKDLLIEAIKQMDEAKSSKDIYKIVDVYNTLSDVRYDPVRDHINTHLGRIISNWKVNILDEEALTKNLLDMEWTFDPVYLQDRINNPIIKNLSAFINNTYGWEDKAFNKAFRKIFWFTGEETIDEMYSMKDSTFRTFIDSLIAKDEKNIPDKREIIKSTFKNLDKYVQFKTPEWDLFDEVLDIALNDRSFVEKLLSVTRKVKWDNIKTFEAIEEYKDGKKVTTINKVSDSMERVLQLDNMEWADVIHINWLGMDWFASMIEWFWENIDKYKKFITEINDKQNTDLLKKLEVGEDYFFIGNYGDKDSVFTFYKTDLPIFHSDIRRVDKAKITIDLYLYDYAYRNWYFVKWSFDNIRKWLNGKAFKTYEEFDKEFSKIKVDNEILPIKDIRKREAFNMSNFTTFDEIKIPLRTFVIEPMMQIPPWLEKYCKFKDTWEFDSFNENYNEEEVRNLIWSLPDYHKDNIANLDSKELQDYITLTFLKDNQDGTSFISKYLAELRWKIRWVKDTHQFKDHFYWDKEDKWSRFWGKTLMNASEIKIEWKTADDVVAIWISSAKLKKWRMEKPSIETITINGREYKVLWEIKNTDTSYFKNASSDTNRTEEEISFSDSIKPKLSKEASDKIEALQLKKIAEAFDRHIASLGKFAVDTNSYWEAIESIKRISSLAWIGRWDTSVVQWKLQAFISEVNQIINKPKEEWQSMFIMQSDSRLWMNEILISRESQLAKWVKNIWEDYYVIGYRYPVPSKYNLWLYKVRFLEDELSKWAEFDMYKNMGDHQVVLNPFVTYVKVEWDNDGDHLFFLAADSELWKIVKDDILNWQDIGSYQNKFILAEQVDKDKPTLDVSIHEWRFTSETRKEIEQDTNSLYVFWDNFQDAKDNYISLNNPTQAIIRWLDNAIWISTKLNRWTDIWKEIKQDFNIINYPSKKISYTIKTLDWDKVIEWNELYVEWIKFWYNDWIVTDLKSWSSLPLQKETNIKKIKENINWLLKSNKEARDYFWIELKTIKTESSFLSDNDFDLFKNHLDWQIDLLKKSWKKIVFPKWWIGTGKAVLETKAPKLFDYLNKRLKEEFWFDNINWKLIIKSDSIKKDQNILESRTVALEAKKSISIVSATIRSIYLLDQLISSYKGWDKKINDYVIPIKRTVEWSKKKETTRYTVWEMVNEYFPNWYQLPDKFAQLSASLLQTTLDFGNSWKTSFDVGEIKELVTNMFPDWTESSVIDEFYEWIIKPLSMTYWIEKNIKRVWELFDVIKVDKKTWLSKLQKVIGSKRTIYEKVIAQYWDHLKALNAPNEFSRFIRTIQVLSPGKELKPVIDYITTDKRARIILNSASFDKKYKVKKDWSFPIEKEVWEKIRELIKKWFANHEWFMKYIQNIDDIYWDNKMDYKLADELKRAILKRPSDKFWTDSKNALWLYAMTYWEKYAFHFLWDAQRIKFFSIADKDFLKTMQEMHWDKISDWERTMTKEERLQELNDAIESFNGILDDSAMEQYQELVRKRDEISDLIEETAEKTDIPVADNFIPTETYEFPDFFTDTIDVSPQSVNELISEHTDHVSKAIEWVKVLISSLFNKYFPRLKITYDEMKFLDAKRNGPIQIAWEEHTKQFSNQVVLWMGYKNSIYQQLKKIWLSKDEISKLSREMQSGFLSYKDWKYQLNSLDDMIRNTSALFEAKKIADLTKNSEFVQEVQSYREKVMVPVLEAVRYIQNYLWYDIHKAYETLDFSMITDIIEARKWDAQLALRLNWIHTKDEFKKQLKENARLLWEDPWQWTINAMTNVLYKTASWIEQVLNFFKSWHYTMTYGTGWFFTWNAIISWLAQVLPNLVELNSYRMFNKQELWLADALIKKYNFIASEDVLAKGTWHGMNMNASWLELFLGKITRDFWNTLTDATGKLIGKVNNNLGQKIVWSRKAWEYMDSVMNNMLGFNDYPLEAMRKQVAVIRTMNNMWIRTLDQFEDAVERGWKNFLSAFESKARTQFAETGWGAVSSSPFERWTIFEHANEYFNNWFTSFAVKSLSYLMGWSFHKFWTLIEKENAWLVWIKKLVSGDLKWAKTHLSDFLSYNAMLAKQYAYVTGVYLKFQKYEKDNQDRLSLEEFQSSFNNSIVAIEILLWKHMEAWKTAWEFGNTEDQLSYTAYTVFDRMFRLFKQPRFFTVMYDKYRSDEMTKWEWDMTDAFFYAIDSQYTSFMRFNWLVDTDDMLSKLSSSDMWMLWVWGSTDEEKLFEELSAWWRFASFQDKWFIWSFLNMFTSMVKTKKSDLSMNVWMDSAQEIYDIIMKDPEISKLVNAGTIGTWAKEYNLATLLGSGILSQDNFENSKELWNLIQERAYNTLDAKWRRLLTWRTWEQFSERNILSFTENVIDNILKEQWITMEQIFSMNPDTQKERLKLMTVLNLEKWVSTPIFLAYMMNKEYYDTRSKLQNEIGQFTGEKSKYGKPYKWLSEEQEWKIRRDIMLKYQELMNYDRTMVHDVLSVAVQKTWEQVFQKFDKLDNGKFMRDNVVDLVNREYLAKSIMARWDTSASSLLSKYALAFKWITSNEEWAKAILKFINDVNSLPYMEKKAKLANTAAMLMALNKTQYNLLKDNKKFQELTKDSQTQLTNWLYDTIKWWYDFDSESIDSKLNSSAYKKSYVKPYYPKWKSQSFGWQRPNFSKQFRPLQDYMNWKEWFLAKDPSSYLQAKNWFEYQSPMRVWDPQNPYMRQYSKYAIEQIYFGQKSKWLIATREQGDNKFETWKKKNINIAKAKKVKKQKPRQSKTFFKEVSKWLMPNLPFSNY